MNLNSLLNLWHLTKKDIELVECLREPFLQGKEFEVRYSKSDSFHWWKEPFKHFSYDFSEKNFIDSFHSPFISSKDQIEISIIKNSREIYKEIITNEEIFEKIGNLCESFKSQKKFKIKIKLINPFKFDYVYSPTQIASLLFLFISGIENFPIESKNKLLYEIIDEEITDFSLLKWADLIKFNLIEGNRFQDISILDNFLLNKDVGVMIRHLDSLK